MRISDWSSDVCSSDLLDLPPGLLLDGLLHEADRVHVLGLRARAQRPAGTAHREVHVGAHRAFVHVAVAGAEIAQAGAQLAQVGPRLLRRAHVRLGDDLRSEEHTSELQSLMRISYAV